MPNPSTNSVTLKINKTSVMLYANQYLRLPDGRGASSQIYLGSFPKTATEMPASFEQKLREYTAGRQERYFSLCERIENEVLIPARIRHRQEAADRHRRELNNALQHVLWGLRNIREMPGYPIYATSAEFQQLLPTLQREMASLLELVPSSPALESPSETAEEKLQRLLDTANSACAEIAALMPTAARGFKRGYHFAEETLLRVRKFWYRSSDAVAALSARKQFRRPTNWTALRAEKLPGTVAKTVEAAPEIRPVAI